MGRDYLVLAPGSIIANSGCSSMRSKMFNPKETLILAWEKNEKDLLTFS
jgi:hypothetical protein